MFAEAFDARDKDKSPGRTSDGNDESADGQFRPDQQITEKRIRETLRLSRGPAREATRVLHGAKVRSSAVSIAQFVMGVEKAWELRRHELSIVLGRLGCDRRGGVLPGTVHGGRFTNGRLGAHAFVRRTRMNHHRAETMQSKMRSHHREAWIGLILMSVVGAAARAGAAEDSSRPTPKTVRDILWVWGNPEMAEGDDAQRTLATFAQASPARRAALLGGLPNIVMAGRGLPDDPRAARSETEAVKHAARLAWEILPDSAKGGEYNEGVSFDYTQRVALLKKLKASYPRIEAVLLDDMSSVAVRKGFKPEHLAALKKLLDEDLALWGVVYTHTLDRPGINEYIKQLDLVSLWTWNAKHLVDREKHVEYLEKTFPGKPILLGVYLYNFGGPGPMPRDMLELQCSTALRLAHEGRVVGIVFLTIHNDPDTMRWTADWIKRVGDQPLAARK